VAILVAVFMGLVFSSQWETFALYLNRGSSDTIVEPRFGLSLSFFFFTLPVLDVVSTWLIALAIVVLIPAILLSVADARRRLRGISIGLALVLASIGFQTYVGRYRLALDEHDLFSGINYVADKVLIPGLSCGYLHRQLRGGTRLCNDVRRPAKRTRP
jgi:uncharacterized membrane protein (UPF0182 family)